VVRVLSRGDVKHLVSMKGALEAVREAFAAADRGRAVMPRPFDPTSPRSVRICRTSRNSTRESSREVSLGEI
jgi:ornithine cyclodeaminase/alanine dehydrogenase-like protein (mu-crystallin family)